MTCIAAVLVTCLVSGFAIGSWVTVGPGEPAPAQLGAAGAWSGTSRASAAPASLVANVRGRGVAVYRRPGTHGRWRWLGNPRAEGTPLVFLVRARRGVWLQVRLPLRPNGSTGWIRGQAVRLAENDFRIRVALRAHSLMVWRGGGVVQRERVGVGRAATPTPAGTYYVTELLRRNGYRRRVWETRVGEIVKGCQKSDSAAERGFRA